MLIPAVWRREARLQRILVVAILFVSSSQFFIEYDPVNQHGGVHTFLGGTNNSNEIRLRSTNSLSSADVNINNNSNSSVGYPANITKNLVFCGYCKLKGNLKTSCNERLKYMMGRHRIPIGVAKEKLMPDCGIDYETEPYVLLHVGPHKTGTTSIQTFLYELLSNSSTIFQKDKFAIPTHNDLPGVFGGYGPMLNFAHCMIKDFTKGGGQMNVGLCNKVRSGKFPKFLQTHYNQSHHVMFVAEDLDRRTIDRNRILYYLQPYRRFKVVVTYRRMHDWLPSWYNQIMDLYLQNYILGKDRYPNFVEWIHTKYDEFSQVHTIEVANRYRKSGHFESVEILNIHDEVSLLENMFCNYVPFANATCKLIKDENKHFERNAGGSLEYERLATKAFLRGKIHHFHVAIARKVSRLIKNDAVERGIFPDGDTYPMICLNQTFLEQLFQTEMQQERKYFPKWYEAQGGGKELRKAFDRAHYKLCSMDDENILSSGILDSIFEDINSGKSETNFLAKQSQQSISQKTELLAELVDQN
mmetsp:Transcript_38436/g.92653  ORF Transcript_38436/g.92653 Transcript_38436/m.92653 type:complete len:528 (-) Transcript_38436:98-1681(-)